MLFTDLNGKFCREVCSVFVRITIAGAVCLFVCALTGIKAYSAPLELLKDNGFEQVSGTAFTDWEPNPSANPPGILTPEASIVHSGGYSAKFQIQQNAWWYCALMSGKSGDFFRVSPGATYHMSVWAKGTGIFRFSVYEFSKSKGWLQTKFLTTDHYLSSSWQKFEADYTPNDNAAYGKFVLQLFDDGSHSNIAYFDDASLTFDPFNPSSNQNVPIDILLDGWFEQVGNGTFADWAPNYNNPGPGILTPETSEVHSGAYSAKFQVQQGAWTYSALNSGNSGKLFPVDIRATYHLKVWAKGTGTFQFAVYEYSKSKGWLVTNFMSYNTLNPSSWTEYNCTYTPNNNPNTAYGKFVINLFDDGSHSNIGYFDDAAVNFYPSENPDVPIPWGEEQPATTSLTLSVTGYNVTGTTLYVGGVPITLQNGTATVNLQEGLLPIAVKATGSGASPGVLVSISGHPEVDGRWKLLSSGSEPDGWKETNFNDSSWETPTFTNGYMWKSGATGTVYFRQTILWNANHYSWNRCIAPMAKNWGFSRSSTEIFHHALYSPLTSSLSNYEIVFEVPVEFTLLDKLGYTPLSYDVYNVQPSSVEAVSGTFTRDGKTCHRYRLLFDAAKVTTTATNWTMLPFQMTGNPSYETCNFFYQRKANGNFTELWQEIPVTILPQINGTQPNNIKIFYHLPLGTTNATIMSDAHLSALISQEAQAGVNAYAHQPNAWRGSPWHDFERLFYDRIYNANCKFILWPCSGFPLNYGYDCIGIAGDYYYNWLQTYTGAHAQYYNNSPIWGSGAPHYNSAYCNKYVMDGGAGFATAVTADLNVMLQDVKNYNNVPVPLYAIFCDWEFTNLNPDGTGIHCFCANCKEAFRIYAGLGTTPTDQEIVGTYKTQWLAFRDLQDGGIQNTMRGICNALGVPYMVYSWSSNSGFWNNCAGKLDIAFPGYPGNNPANSYCQAGMDSTYAYFHNLNFTHVTSQRFQFNHDASSSGWNNAYALTYDGFVDAKSWKSQLLRMAATFHGNIDLAEGANTICAGSYYYIGEATRIIAQYETLFLNGTRMDALASSAQIAYPNLLVLENGTDRLVLLFNEGNTDLSVTIQNSGLQPGQLGQVFGTTEWVNPASMNITIPAQDVRVIYIH